MSRQSKINTAGNTINESVILTSITHMSLMSNVLTRPKFKITFHLSKMSFTSSFSW